MLWGDAWGGCRDRRRKTQVCRFSARLCRNAAFCEQWHVFVSASAKIGTTMNQNISTWYVGSDWQPALSSTGPCRPLAQPLRGLCSPACAGSAPPRPAPAHSWHRYRQRAALRRPAVPGHDLCFSAVVQVFGSNGSLRQRNVVGRRWHSAANTLAWCASAWRAVLPVVPLAIVPPLDCCALEG